MFIGRLVAISLICAAGAFADPSLTTIQDTLFKADGTRMNGTAVITWNSFESSDTSSIGQQSLSVAIVNGAIYVQLVPNSTANPPQQYVVTYSSDGKFQFQETWLVPPSISPLHVRDVRTSTSTTNTGAGAGGLSGGGNATGTVGESTVTGLVADLSARPIKGPSFGTGRVAMVDQNGALNTVLGNFSDCVYVNGTSGPCFDPTQLPQFGDAESPAGNVDGANATFGLLGQPTPSRSLILFRNGMAQKPNVDYTLTGSVLQFATESTPQPGDTVMAWYRTSSAASLQSGSLTTPAPGVTVTAPQVICSSGGTQTSNTSLTSLGSCSIPASFLGSGDRLEVRFLFAHDGSSSAFTAAVNWGSTTMVRRAFLAGDSTISGRFDASITAGVTQLAGDTFGTSSPILPALVSASDSNANLIKIGLQGAITSAGSDVVRLVNFTVIRYPAVSNP